MVWLVENLKLKVTNYSRELYNPEGVAHPSEGGDNDDDDVDDGDEEEEEEVTPSYQSRKR